MKAQYENDTIILYALLEKRNCANINAGARICDFARKFDVPIQWYNGVLKSNKSTQRTRIGQFTWTNKMAKSTERTHVEFSECYDATHILIAVAICEGKHCLKMVKSLGSENSAIPGPICERVPSLGSCVDGPPGQW
jgi:hypothetical protein